MTLLGIMSQNNVPQNALYVIGCSGYRSCR